MRHGLVRAVDAVSTPHFLGALNLAWDFGFHPVSEEENLRKRGGIFSAGGGSMH